MLIRLLVIALIAGLGASTAARAADWVSHIDIPAHTPAPWPAEMGDVAINVPCPNTMSGRCDLDGYLEWQNVCALYVLRGGALALYRERTPKGACRTSRDRERYGVASITKSIMSLVYGEALQGDPALAPDAFAAEALAKAGVAYPRPDRTLRDLLRMSSGMKWRDKGPEASVIRVTKKGDPATLAKSVDAYLAKAAFGNVGDFNYSGFDSTLAGLAADAGQGRLEELFISRIWEEIGGGHPLRWKSDEAQTPSPYCCLQMAPDDLAKIGQWVLKALKSGGDLAAWVKRSITDAHPSDEACSFGGALRPVLYGYQWWIPPSAIGGFTAIGVGGQYLHIFPDRDVVVVQFSDDDRSHTSTNRCGAFRAHQAIASALTD